MGQAEEVLLMEQQRAALRATLEVDNDGRSNKLTSGISWESSKASKKKKKKSLSSNFLWKNTQKQVDEWATKSITMFRSDIVVNVARNVC